MEVDTFSNKEGCVCVYKITFFTALGLWELKTHCKLKLRVLLFFKDVLWYSEIIGVLTPMQKFYIL